MRGEDGTRLGARRRVAAVGVLVAAVLAWVIALPPAASASAPSGGASSRPTIETFALPSPLVDTSTPGGKLAPPDKVPTVRVYLPAGYAQHPNRRYPVLWLLHGAENGGAAWTPTFTNILTANAFNGIAVMPDGGTFGMYMNWWNGGTRGGPAWATYDLQFLRGVIEQRYRVRSGRRWHAIAGISMGGQGALRYAAMLPGYFGSVAGFSAAVPDTQSLLAQVGLPLLATAGGSPGATYGAIFGPANAPYATGNNPQALAANYSHTRVFLMSGDGLNCARDKPAPSLPIDITTEVGVRSQQGPFAQALRALGADVTAQTPCGVHTWGVWERALPKALAWGFFRPVDEHPSTWTYRTIATSGDMWNLHYVFDQPPTQVATFTRHANTLDAAGTGTVQLTAGTRCSLTFELPTNVTLPPACH